MKKIDQIIVVEGKSDTQLLKTLFDVETIETNGLSMSDEILEYIAEMHDKKGVIVLTDPDYPGQCIRQRIIERVPGAKHAFVEKKDAVGKKKLGIAEARESAVIEALENLVTFGEHSESITWSEFIDLDIIGDKEKRLEVYRLFHLGYGNAKTLFKRLNMAQITQLDIIEMYNKKQSSES